MSHEIPDDFEHAGNAEHRTSNIEHRTLNGEVEDEREGEALLNKCCADLGFNMAVALQALSWADGALNTATLFYAAPRLMSKCCREVGLKANDAREFLMWCAENVRPGMPEAAGVSGAGCQVSGNPDQDKLMASLIKILEYGFKKPGLIPAFAVRYAFDQPLLDDIIGHHNPASFAKSIGVEREAVNKEVLAVQRYFRLPARRGQRGKTARENMSKARLGQLKPGTSNIQH